MTKAFLESIGCRIANPFCSHCNRGESTIQYCIEHYGADDTGRYIPLCTKCAEHIALGMLRDIAEVKYGKAKTDSVYRAFMAKHLKGPH